MNQSVNFLKVLPKSTNRLTVGIMGLVVLATLVILIIISIVLGLINFQAQQLNKKAQRDLIAAQQSESQLAKTYPLLASDIPFVQRVKDLENEFASKKVELNALEHLIIRRGFSQYMFDLAQVTPNSLWLNEIQINLDSTSYTLNGYAIRPDSISELMSRLLNANAFKNVIFNLFFVKTIKNHSYLKFSIATKELGPEEDAVLEQSDQNNRKPKE